MVFIILLSIAAASLLSACVMDQETHMVYDYVWWVGGVAGGILMLLSDNNMWLSVALFILLQELFFCKMYGRADCHGFVVCALIEAAYGMSMQGYLLHMLFAFCLLAVVQLVSGNVGRDGKLKRPVPFLPFMTIAFWLNLLVYLYV